MSTDIDTPLPFDIAPIDHATSEEQDMPVLPLGAAIRVPALQGRWSVWLQSDESPGAHFLIPADEEARATGIKYAVVRAKMPRGADKPLLTLLRTDPTTPVPA